MQNVDQAQIARLDETWRLLVRARDLMTDACSSAQFAYQATKDEWIGEDYTRFGEDVHQVILKAVAASTYLTNQANDYRRIMWELQHGQR